MKNMNKAKYFSPEITFVCIRSEEDILLGSFNAEDDENQSDYGVLFPY